MKSYDHMVRHVNKRKARSVKAMSGCLDRVDCSCECLEPAKEWLKPKRNMIASIISGTLFALGWWVVIDACADHAEPIYAAYHICGIFSTIALLMINAISMGQVTGDTYTEGCLGRKVARAWLFVGFLFSFGGLIGSLWVFIQMFLVPAVTESPNSGGSNVIINGTFSNDTGNITTPTGATTEPLPAYNPYWWQGIAFFLQNLFIFMSTLVFKFGRTEEEVW